MQGGHSLQPSLCGKNTQTVTKEASARSDEDSLSEEGPLPGRARHPAEHSRRQEVFTKSSIPFTTHLAIDLGDLVLSSLQCNLWLYVTFTLFSVGMSVIEPKFNLQVLSYCLHFALFPDTAVQWVLLSLAQAMGFPLVFPH